MAIVLGWQNLCDTASSIRATLTEDATSAARVLTPQLSDAYSTGVQTSAASLFRLYVDLGAAASNLRLFVFALPPDAAIPTSPTFMRVFADLTTEGGSGVLFGPDDNATILAGRYWVYLHGSNLTARHLTWRFTWDATIDPIIRTGRIYAGPALVTEQGPGLDLAQEIIEADISERAGRGGLRLSQTGARRRRLSFSAPRLTAAEAVSVAAMGRAAGLTGQVFVAPRSDSRVGMSSEGFFGHLADMPSPVATNRGGRFSAQFAVEEDI